MSRKDIFDGIEDTLTPEEREHYEPGVVGFDLALVEHLVDRFISTKMKTHYNRLSSEVSYLKGILPTADDEEFKPNAFLDEIVARMNERLPPSRIRSTNRLFDPLIQALYENGHNDFVLDLMPLQFKAEDALFPIYRLADNLEGTCERPLSISYRAHTEEFAMWVRFCDIQLDGHTSEGGYCAYKSTLAFNGKVKTPGCHAEESVLHLEEMDSQVIISTDCTYHAHSIPKGFPEDHYGTWQWFFEQGNILVYLKDGEWTEVKP